eukprot:9175278-Heterocapsa_arctica.AAC.1
MRLKICAAELDAAPSLLLWSECLYFPSWSWTALLCSSPLQGAVPSLVWLPMLVICSCEPWVLRPNSLLKPSVSVALRLLYGLPPDLGEG